MLLFIHAVGMTENCVKDPDNKVHGANMVPTWILSVPDGPMLAPWSLLSGELSRCEGWWVSRSYGDSTSCPQYWREYQWSRQRKWRAYKKQCLDRIQHSHFNHRGMMWRNDITGDTYVPKSTPSAPDSNEYFSDMSKTADVAYLTCEFEVEAK